MLVPTSTVASASQIKQTVDSMINRYEYEIRELESLSERYSVEELPAVKASTVQGICLDIANDLSTMTHFKINNPGDYYLKFVDPAISYLREMRQILNLYTVAERIN